jgi:hypothetical protein
LELDSALAKRLRENGDNVNRISHDNPNDAWYYDGIYNDLIDIVSNTMAIKNVGAHWATDDLLLHNEDGHIRIYEKKRIKRRGIKDAVPTLSVMSGNAEKTRDAINRVIIGLEEYLSKLKK